jgi:hypothetical protein
MVLHFPGSERIKERRQDEYTCLINGRTILPTERPYTAKETFESLEGISVLKNPIDRTV